MKKSSLILLFFPLLMFGQESDFKLWSKASLNYSINKKTDITFSQGLRLRENANIKEEVFSNFSISRKWNKKWRFAIDYRFIEEYDFYSNSKLEHRISVDASWRKKIDRLTLKSRSRFQYTSNLVFRKRLSLHYNLPKTPLEPSLLFESYYDFSTFSKIRATLSASYPLAKSIDLDLYYRLQNNLNESSIIYILGLGFSYDI